MTDVFNVGDIVFAKVRGYSAWPARVDRIIEGPSDKSKYGVIFFGTSETSVCKHKDLYNYKEHEDSLGQPKGSKKFNVALSEAKEALRCQTVGNRRGKKRNDCKDSVVEGKTVINENPGPSSKNPDGKKKGKKMKRENGREHSNDVSADLNSYGRSKPPLKRFKIGSAAQKDINVMTACSTSETSVNDTVSTQPKTNSQHGQKVKPRKFAAVSDKDAVLKSNAEVNHKMQLMHNQGGATTNGDMKQQPRISVKTPAALNSSIPSCSGYISDEKRKTKLAWFRTEASMLETESELKSTLCLENANAAEGVRLLTLLNTLGIKPLMLKKHPHVVSTIRKLRRYVGNSSEWNLTEVEECSFKSHAIQIRSMCDSIFNKFRALFEVPDNSTFTEVFSEEVATFQRLTESLSVEKICALTEEPSLQTRNLSSVQFQMEPKMEASGLQESGTKPELQLSEEGMAMVIIKSEPLDPDEVLDDAPSSPLPADEGTGGTGTLKSMIEACKGKELVICLRKVESDCNNLM